MFNTKNKSEFKHEKYEVSFQVKTFTSNKCQAKQQNYLQTYSIHAPIGAYGHTLEYTAAMW